MMLRRRSITVQVTCYVSLGNYPRQVSWRTERLKAAAFIALPAPDIPRSEIMLNGTPSGGSGDERSRPVRSEAFDEYLTEEQRQTLWKHMDHLSSELYDRNRVRREQRERTDNEYRQHLLTIRAELTKKIIAETQAKLQILNGTDDSSGETMSSLATNGKQFVETEPNVAYGTDEETSSEFTMMHNEDNVKIDYLLNSLDDLGHRAETTQAKPERSSSTTRTGSTGRRVPRDRPARETTAGQGDESKLDAEKEQIRKTEADTKRMHPQRRMKRANDDVKRSVDREKKTKKWKRMARIDDDDIEEERALNAEKKRLQQEARLPDPMHPVPDVPSDDGSLPSTFSKLVLFDYRLITIVVFVCCIVSTWICVPFWSLFVAKSRWKLFKNYFKCAKIFDTWCLCQDSTYRPMVHAFRFLDIQPPTYNQYMTLKEAIGFENNTTKNMMHYVQLGKNMIAPDQKTQMLNQLEGMKHSK